MAKRCPGCGSAYNGRFCRSCYYTSFPEAVQTSYEDGYRPQRQQTRRIPEPRRINGKLVFPRRTSSRRKDGKNPGGAVVAVLLAVFLSTGLLPALLGLAFETVESVFTGVEAVDLGGTYERPALPENGRILYDSGDIQLILGWQEGMPLVEDIPIFLVNDTDRDLTATSSFSMVNDKAENIVFFYCEALSGRIGRDTVWIDMEELKEQGITTIEAIVLDIEIYDEDYETVAEPFQVTLVGPEAVEFQG